MPPGSAAGRFRPQRCSGIVSEVSVLVGTRPAKTRSRISSTVGPTCGAREVAAACAGRLSRGQPVVPGAEYQEAQQTPARALSRAWAYLDLKLIQRYVDINLLRPSHKWVQTLTVEGQTLQTNNQRSKPLGHRVSAYQKLAPRHRSEPFSIVLSVLKDWGLQYQGMKHDETSSPFFFSIASLTLFWRVLAEFFPMISIHVFHGNDITDQAVKIDCPPWIAEAWFIKPLPLPGRCGKQGISWYESWILHTEKFLRITLKISRDLSKPVVCFLLVGWGKLHENNLERTVPVEWSFLVAQAWNSVMGSYQPAAGRGRLVHAEWVSALCEEGEDKVLVKW